MDAKDLLLNSLQEREADYRGKLERCQEDFSRKAVHDLRTSIRRFLAALDVSAFLTSEARVEKLSDRLKDQLEEAGDLRDVQVMLRSVSENREAVQELAPFQEYLENREKRKQRTGEKHVQDIKPGGIQKKLLKIRADLEELPAEELNGKLPQAVDQAHLTVIQRYGEIDPDRLLSIHHLRVAFKKFRYMVEVIALCLPGFPADQLERMHTYQTRMGDIHDTEVLLEALSRFARNNDAYNPQPARRFYEQILAQALLVYLADMGEVLTFWRATPIAVFPWTANQIRKEE